MNELSGILFHVYLMKSDTLLARSDRLKSACSLYSAVCAVSLVSAVVADHAVLIKILAGSGVVYLNISVKADRMIKLRYLVILRQVRIEVILSVEYV